MNETFSKISDKSVVRKPLAPKTEANKTESANNDADEPQDHPFQLAEPTENFKYRRSLRYTHWKVRRVRFCHTFPREPDD